MLPVDSHPRQAGGRLQAFLAHAPGLAAVIARSGITTSLLHDLLDAEDLPPQPLHLARLAA